MTERKKWVSVALAALSVGLACGGRSGLSLEERATGTAGATDGSPTLPGTAGRSGGVAGTGHPARGGSAGAGGAGSPPGSCERGECADGELWNPWTRRCQSDTIACPPPGSDNGGPCSTEKDCRSSGSELAGAPLCITQNGADYCVSYCQLPGGAFGDADAFERSDCPYGSVCFQANIETPPGWGRCVRECRDDGDCRSAEGYYCRRTFQDRTYTNGYCAPAHCSSRGCILTYECEC